MQAHRLPRDHRTGPDLSEVRWPTSWDVSDGNMHYWARTLVMPVLVGTIRYQDETHTYAEQRQPSRATDRQATRQPTEWVRMSHAVLHALIPALLWPQQMIRGSLAQTAALLCTGQAEHGPCSEHVRHSPMHWWVC